MWAGAFAARPPPARPTPAARPPPARRPPAARPRAHAHAHARTLACGALARTPTRARARALTRLLLQLAAAAPPPLPALSSPTPSSRSAAQNGSAYGRRRGPDPGRGAPPRRVPPAAGRIAAAVGHAPRPAPEGAVRKHRPPAVFVRTPLGEHAVFRPPRGHAPRDKERERRRGPVLSVSCSEGYTTCARCRRRQKADDVKFWSTHVPSQDGEHGHSGESDGVRMADMLSEFRGPGTSVDRVDRLAFASGTFLQQASVSVNTFPPRGTAAEDLTEELKKLFSEFQQCLELRDRYMAHSLQRFEDNPKDRDDWKIYPTPPAPTWVTPLGADAAKPTPSAPLLKPDHEEFDLGCIEIPGPVPYHFEMDAAGVYQTPDTENFVPGHGTAGIGSKPRYHVPTIKTYYQDLDYVLSLISDGPAKVVVHVCGRTGNATEADIRENST
ncbi:MAG: hypothetical protein BJ554DRAFT_5143 [Olpidium bornovanus]|uniref:Uncharacterized protein n=1 Tax=Olpidium bornovanus TaxID=278681 RepID=A0A8H8A0J0_9FUNG|nr:MAG: hypothetical protein BJ554DRAFT_5143 [Olpidium bornovanus]